MDFLGLTRGQFQQARNEPLITLGSAPLHVPEFRAVVLGQLGEQRLDVAIDADIAGATSHAKGLDADTKGALRDIHRRVGTAVLFESSGGQAEKVAHLPELRFALGEPVAPTNGESVDTTTIDNAAAALEKAGFFFRKVGTDGYRIHHQATLRKAVSDRRASLDQDTEIRPAVRRIVEDEFKRFATIPVVYFPEDGDTVPDSPRLTLAVVNPAEEWRESGPLRRTPWPVDQGAGQVAKTLPGRLGLVCSEAWDETCGRVLNYGSPGSGWRTKLHRAYSARSSTIADRAEVQARVKEAEGVAKDEVWAGYRFVALGDAQAANGLKIIDLGAGHASGSETLCGRIIAALKSDALLNESVGAGYIDRHWPPAFKGTGAWPLTGLRQSFLNGALTRLIDPDTVLRRQIVDFVSSGDFGLASGAKGDGRYERAWYAEPMGVEEVAFEANVFLLTKARAEQLRAVTEVPPQTQPEPRVDSPAEPQPEPDPANDVLPDGPSGQRTMLRLTGTVPPEVWNRLGTKLIPKLRSGDDLSVGVDFSVSIESPQAENLEAELRQVLADLGLSDQVRIEP